MIDDLPAGDRGLTWPPPEPLVIVGPTASGKSALAMSLAERLMESGRPVELITADSMQVYRGMDIGTAKPTASDQSRVIHHLIDIVDPHQEFSVAEFQTLARAAIDGARSRGAGSIVVGGTGLYIQALVDGLSIPGQFPDVRASVESEPDTSALYERVCELDPVAATRIDPLNRRRIVRALEVTIGSGRPFSSYGPGLDQFPPRPFRIVGLDIDREVLTSRIRERLEGQLEEGFLDETRRLLERGNISRTAAQALGYNELHEVLIGTLTLDEALELAALRTRKFAIRQIRWFRRDPRITWFRYDTEPTEVTGDLSELWLTSDS